MKTYCLTTPRSLLYIIPLFCATFFSIASSLENEDLIIATGSGSYCGTNYTATLLLKDIESAPKWDGLGGLPLSTINAMTEAAHYLSSKFQGPPEKLSTGLQDSSNTQKKWLLSEMSIHRFYTTDMWYYEIKMNPLIQGSYNWPAVTIFMNMNGKVSAVAPYTSTSAPGIPKGK